MRALALVALLAACAPQGAPTVPANPQDTMPMTPEPASTACDIEVSYGSFGPGIDTELKQRVSDLVQDDPDVVDISESPWGREGESTLCLRTRNGTAANRLFDAIVAMLPTTAPRAPTTVTHRDGRSRAVGSSSRRHS